MKPCLAKLLSSNRRFGLVAALVLSPFCSQAATFSIPDLSENPASTFQVPINVSQFTGEGFQFSLSWTPSVIAFQSDVENVSGTFTYNRTDVANGSWAVVFERPGVTTEINGPVLTLTFTVAGAPNSSTAISFGDVPTDRVPAPGVATWTDGSVTVVPEPINLALGLFAGVFAAGTAFRRVANK